MALWRQKLQAAWQQEEAQRRHELTVAIFMAIGVALYFSAPQEPWWPYPILWMLIWAVLARSLHGHTWSHRFCLVMMLTALGFSSASIRATRIEAPVVPHRLVASIEGYVQESQSHGDKTRLWLQMTAWDRSDPMPARVRLNIPPDAKVKAGDHVRLKATLFPPAQPARPEGYDFALDAYFQQLGGVGRALSSPELSPAQGQPPLNIRWSKSWEAWRSALHERILTAAGNTSSAQIAAALITGKRGDISDEANEALLAAGLVHVLSISGLHLMLFGGALFWLSRRLCLIAEVAKGASRQRSKIYAAWLTMLGITFYAVLSGFEVATERAWIMMMVSLGAVVMGRQALTMRNVAISAIILLLHRPESLMSISAQLSFASVAILIAGFESGMITGRYNNEDKPSIRHMPMFERLTSRLMYWIRVVTVSGVLATLATTPLIAFHFQRSNPWGVLGNILTEPITGFIIMPMGLLGLLALPLGWDGPFWQIMSWGCEQLVNIAILIAQLPKSTLHFQAPPWISVLVFILALTWACVWISWLRFLSFLLIPLAGTLIFIHKGPTVRVDPSGRVAAFEAPDGRWRVINGAENRFAVASWLSAVGDTRLPDNPHLSEGISCSRDVCFGPLKGGGTIAVVNGARGIRPACEKATLVIAPRWQIYAPCNVPYFDRTIARWGSAADIYKDSNGAWRLQAARPKTHHRPWFSSARNERKSKPAQKSE